MCGRYTDLSQISVTARADGGMIGTHISAAWGVMVDTAGQIYLHSLVCKHDQ